MAINSIELNIHSNKLPATRGTRFQYLSAVNAGMGSRDFCNTQTCRSYTDAKGTLGASFAHLTKAFTLPMLGLIRAHLTQGSLAGDNDFLAHNPTAGSSTQF